MADEAIKKRVSRAKQSALDVLERAKYDVIPSDNRIFCLIASRDKEVRWIKVVVDECTEFEISCVRDFKTPFSTCTKEVWVKKSDDAGFEIMEIR